MLHVLATQTFSDLDAAAPRPLPAPPVLEQHLLEQPLYAIVATIGISMVAYALFSTRGKSRAARVTVAVGAALAAMFLGVATLVDTDREVVKRNTRAMIAAVAEADAARLEPLLEEGLAVYAPPLSDTALNKSEVIARVNADFGPGRPLRIRSWTVNKIEAFLDGPRRAVVQVKVTVTPEEMPAPTPSWWRIEFEMGPGDQWRISGIKMLSLGGLGGKIGSGF